MSAGIQPTSPLGHLAISSLKGSEAERLTRVSIGVSNFKGLIFRRRNLRGNLLRVEIRRYFELPNLQP
jgi:hypothetical protein